MELNGKRILITGGAVRIGRAISKGLAEAGADVLIHYASSNVTAQNLRDQLHAEGLSVEIHQADFNSTEETQTMIQKINSGGKIYALINNAAIYDDLDFFDTTIDDWNRHINVNITAPFLLCKGLNFEAPGRIINILDWKALRPQADHFAYTISKAGLLAMTQSMAIALAPEVTVNGIALGAVLPASDGTTNEKILESVPQKRWAELDEVVQTVRFLVEGPEYITGEVIHLDGGRHLV